MKILLVTPLYPPDTAEPAPYIKELALRLSKRHLVTILTYGKLPEEIPGVRIIAVSKKNILPVRIMTFVWKLGALAKEAELVYAENGPSVEFPLLLTHTPRLIFHRGDVRAYTHSRSSFFQIMVLKGVERKSTCVIDTSPNTRPEILPFEEFPQSAFDVHENSWTKHLSTIEALCKNN